MYLRFLYIVLINWIKILCCWKQISTEKTRGVWAWPVHKCIAELQQLFKKNENEKSKKNKTKYNTQRRKKTNCNRSPWWLKWTKKKEEILHSQQSITFLTSNKSEGYLMTYHLAVWFWWWVVPLDSAWFHTCVASRLH